MSHEADAVIQAAFDKATAAVIAQGKRSIADDGDSCLYRGPNGTKCAVGHLMSDEQMSRFGIQEDSNPYVFPFALIEELLPGVNQTDACSFLSQIQRAHDRASTFESTFVVSFKDAANRVADNYGLKPIKD
jgi:hypothetical protein